MRYCFELYLDIIMGRQLDKLMPFWQPANILHSVFIFMLLWQINVVVVVLVADILKFVTMFVTSFGKKG